MRLNVLRKLLQKTKKKYKHLEYLYKVADAMVLVMDLVLKMISQMMILLLKPVK